MKLAGKFDPLLARGKAALTNAAMNPALSTLGAGAAAAGLATLGNVVTGQAQEKSPGRLIAEALGAGALGAGVGATLGPGYMNRLVKAGSTSPKAEFALGTGIGVLGAGALGGAIGGGDYERSPR
jgi:hypothetical protein